MKNQRRMHNEHHRQRERLDGLMNDMDVIPYAKCSATIYVVQPTMHGGSMSPIREMAQLRRRRLNCDYMKVDEDRSSILAKKWNELTCWSDQSQHYRSIDDDDDDNDNEGHNFIDPLWNNRTIKNIHHSETGKQSDWNMKGKRIMDSVSFLHHHPNKLQRMQESLSRDDA